MLTNKTKVWNIEIPRTEESPMVIRAEDYKVGTSLDEFKPIINSYRTSGRPDVYGMRRLERE